MQNLKRSGALRAALLAAALLLFTGCGGDDGSSDSSGEARSGASESDGSAGDCSLLSDEEIETATGMVPARSEVPAIGGGCTWISTGDAALMVLDIGDDTVSTPDGPGSRYESTLARHEASGIESTDVDNIGDRANVSGSPVANNIVVVQGDEFLELTVNQTDGLTDGAVEDLMVLVIDRR